LDHPLNSKLFNQWYTDHLEAHDKTGCNTVIDIYWH